jgi:hypothetical protein
MLGWALLDTHKYAPKEFGLLLDFVYEWLDAPELSFKIAYNFETAESTSKYLMMSIIGK